MALQPRRAGQLRRPPGQPISPLDPIALTQDPVRPSVLASEAEPTPAPAPAPAAPIIEPVEAEPVAPQQLRDLTRPPINGRTVPTVQGPAQRAVAAAIDRTGADLPRPPGAPAPGALPPIQPQPGDGLARSRTLHRDAAKKQAQLLRPVRDALRPSVSPLQDRSIRSIPPDLEPQIAAGNALRVAAGDGGGLFAGGVDFPQLAEIGERVETEPQGEGFEPVRNLFRGLAVGGLGIGESMGTILRYLGGEGNIDAVAALGENIEGFFQPRMQKFVERAAQTFKADQNIVENPELLLDPDFLTFSVGQIVPSLLATLTPAGLARSVVRKEAVKSLAKKRGLGAEGVEKVGERVPLDPKALAGLSAAERKAAGFEAVGGTIGRYVKIGDKALDLTDAKVIAKLTRIGKAATTAGLAAGGTFGGMLEGSSTYRETFDTLIAQGVPEDVARETAENAFLMMTAGSGILNSIGLSALLKAAPKLTSLAGVKARTIRGLQEGLTEYLEGPLEAAIQFGQGTITVEQAVQKMKDEANVAPAAFLTAFFLPGAGGALGFGNDSIMPPAQEASDSIEDEEAGELPDVDPAAGPAGQAVNVITEEASGTAQAEGEEVDETTRQEPDEGEAAAGKAKKAPAAPAVDEPAPSPAPEPEPEVVELEELLPEDAAEFEPEPTAEQLAEDEARDEPTADDILNARGALAKGAKGELLIKTVLKPRLVEIAEQLGVETTGKKAVLIERITAAAEKLVAGRDVKEITDAEAIRDTEDQVQGRGAVVEGGGGEGGGDLQQQKRRAKQSEKADREGSKPRPAKAGAKVKRKPSGKKPAAKATEKKAARLAAQRKAKAAEKKKARPLVTQNQLEEALRDPDRVLTEDDINLDVFNRSELKDSLRFMGQTVGGNKSDMRQRLIETQVTKSKTGKLRGEKIAKTAEQDLLPGETVSDRITRVSKEPDPKPDDESLLSTKELAAPQDFVVSEDKQALDIMSVTQDGRRISYMGARKRGGTTLQIISASVKEPSQGKGIGQQLIIKMHELATSRGLSLVSDTTVSTDQLRAYMGLRRKGWEITFTDEVQVKDIIAQANARGTTKFLALLNESVVVRVRSPQELQQDTAAVKAQQDFFKGKVKRVKADEVVRTREAVEAHAQAVIGDQTAIDFSEQTGTPAPVDDEELDRQAQETAEAVPDEITPDQESLFDREVTGVGKPTVTKGGKLVGQPEGVTTKRQSDIRVINIVQSIDEADAQTQIDTATATVAEISKKGTTGPSQDNLSSLFWYERAAAEVIRISRGSRKRADQLFRLLALYSQANAVSSNTTAAINTLNEFLNGNEEPAFGRFPNRTQHLVKPILEAESMAIFVRDSEGDLTELERSEPELKNVGPKMVSFYGNLRDAGFNENTFKDDTTIDRWMMRLLGYKTLAPSPAQYAFAKQMMLDATAVFNQIHGTNIKPRQLQAVLWTQTKNRSRRVALSERKQVKKQFKSNSVNALLKQKKMTRQRIVEIANLFSARLGGKDSPAFKALIQRPAKQMLERMRPVILKTTPGDFVPQVETFQDTIKKVTQQVTGEVLPSADTAAGAVLQSAPADVQQQVTQDGLGALVNKETGADELAEQIGISLGFSEIRTGGFEGNVTPVVVTGVVPGGNQTTGFNRDAVNLYARAWQYLFRQKAVPWFRAIPQQNIPQEQSATDFAQARYFRFNRELTVAEEDQFLFEMRFQVHDQIGFTRVGVGEYVVINYRKVGTDTPIIDNFTDNDFKKMMHAFQVNADATLGDGVAEFSEFRAEGEYHGNHNWQEDPEGQAIAADIIARGSPDLLKWLDSRREVLDRIASRAAGTVSKDESLFSAAGFAERQTETPRSERRDVRAPVPLARLADTFGTAIEEIIGRFGTFTGKNTQEQLKIYPLQDLATDPQRVLDQAAQHGFLVKFFSFEENKEAGVEFVLPRLKRDGYSQGTVWIYNPGNMAGSFKDKDYTLAWRVTHETAHGITEQFMEEKYGESKRYGRMGRTTKGIRGVGGKQVEVTLSPLSLTHAQRAVEWEEVTFRVQRMLLEELGIEISNEQFNQENRINISDAMYRSLTGEFSEAGEAGFLPDSTPLDVKDILISLEETEAGLAAEQSREASDGINLNTWQQIPDSALRKAIEGAKKNGRANPTAQAAATKQSTTGAILTEADLRPGDQAPEVTETTRHASAAEGAAEQLTGHTSDSILFSTDDRVSTVTAPKDRGKSPSTPLKVADVRFHLLEIIQKLSPLINIEVVESIADLPVPIRIELENKRVNAILGLYNPTLNTIFIVTDNAVSLAGTERTILHEAFGHFAMSNMPNWEGIKTGLQKLITDNEDLVVRRILKSVVAKQVPLNQLIDEVIAEMSEDMNSRNAVMKEAIAFVKELIRSLGFTIELSNTDVMALIRASRRRIERRALAAAGLGIDRSSEKYQDFLKSDNLSNLRKATTDQEIGIALSLLSDEFELSLFQKSAPMNTELDDEWDKKMNTPFRELSWRDRMKKSMQMFHDLSFDELTQGLLDSANAVKTDEIAAFGQVLDASVSAHKAMSTIRNMNNVMGAVMRHGIPAIKENFITLADKTKVRGLNFTNAEDSQSFQEIFTPLGQIEGESQLRNWEKWMVATRAGRLIKDDRQAGRLGKQRREKLVEQDLVDKTLQWARDHKAGNGKTYEEIFNEVNDNWQKLNDANLDLAVQTGVIDQAEREIWQQYDYIPFWREMTQLETRSKPGAGRDRIDVSSAGLFRLRGGVDRDGTPTRLEGNVLESMFMNTAYLLERSYRNEATRRTKDVGLRTGTWVKEPQVARPQQIPTVKTEELIEMLWKSGLINAKDVDAAKDVFSKWSKSEKKRWETFFNRVKPPGTDIVTVMEKGKPVYYRITDRLMLRSIVGMQGQNLGTWMTAMRTSKKWLTVGVTTDPAFMLANWMRDTVQTFVVSKAPLHSLADPIKSLAEAYNDSPAMLALAFAGRGGGGFYDTHPDRIRDLLKQMGVPGNELTGFMKTVVTPQKMWQWWKRVGTASEFGNRVRVYNSLKLVWDRRIAELGQQGIKGQAAFQQATSEGLASPAEAAYQAQDLLNFTRSGDFTAIQNLIQIVPFLNARLQGINKLWRGAREDPRGFAMKGGTLAALSLALAIANDDDDRYNELSEWDKDTYYHFWIQGAHWRLPKPFESGVLFSTIPERIWRAGRGIDGWDEFSRSMLHAALDTFAFNPIPQLAKPWMEDYFNVNIFTSAPIIPAGMENLLPQRQYDWRTGEFARWVGDAMPDFVPDVMQSPKRIEHLMRGYFGALGVYSLAVANVMTDTILHGPDRALGEITAKRLHELPVISRFKRGDVPTTTKYNRILWEMVREADSIARTIKKYQEEGEGFKALDIVRDERQLLAIRPALRRISTQVSAVNKQLNAIALDRRLSPERRAILRDNLLKQRNRLTASIEPLLDLL